MHLFTAMVVFLSPLQQSLALNLSWKDVSFLQSEGRDRNSFGLITDLPALHVPAPLEGVSLFLAFLVCCALHPPLLSYISSFLV